VPTLWGYLDPAEHAHMLLDPVRVEAYARAIAAVVRPGDVVIDIGTGTGVLAILAAKAGARRVYAIERSGVVELARKHVAENGLTGVVEVIRADLTEIESLPEPPRVVLGEHLGNFAPGEHQHRLYGSARRLAAPDAVAIPSRYRMVWSAVRARGLHEDLARLRSLHGVSMTSLVEKMRARPAFVSVTADDLLGPEIETEWIATDGPPPRLLQARVPVASDGEVGAICLGFTAELAPGVELRTAIGAPRTHWSQTLFPVDPPLPARAGDVLDVELALRVVTNVATWAWTVSLGDAFRSADAFEAMLGDKADMLAALQARPHPTTPVPTPAAVRAWAAALGGVVGDTIDPMALAERAREAMPARYPTVEEALQDVLSLLAAAGRVG
jgi:protein arginine N-methyltransferase 1